MSDHSDVTEPGHAPPTRRSATPRRVELVDWVLVGALLLTAVVAIAFAAGFEALAFDEQALMNVGNVLAPLVVVSAFIERGVEVILTPLRGDAAESLRASIRKAKAADADASPLEVQLLRHRQTTRQVAFVLAVAFGLLSSLVGFRGISNLVSTPAAIPDAMKVLDVFLTGLVLGGGADGIHKIVKVITSYTDLITTRNEERHHDVPADSRGPGAGGG